MPRSSWLAGLRPAVGDWVALGSGGRRGPRQIEAILPRTSVFVRKVAGAAVREQVVAANLDVVFVVTDAGPDFNVRRLERYLAATWSSGATPVIVINKIDLATDLEATLDAVRKIALGVDVLSVSAIDGTGQDALESYLAPRKTVALLGSSGVGKSTLVNRLIGREKMATAAIRESDGRGRHTTSHRELLRLPSGALIIDTPGMRELGLWDADDGLAETFADIASIASECRFRDCTHGAEPGCAVRQAVEGGDLDHARVESFKGLKKELDLQDDRRVVAERREAKRRDKAFGRLARRVDRDHPKR